LVPSIGVLAFASTDDDCVFLFVIELSGKSSSFYSNCYKKESDLDLAKKQLAIVTKDEKVLRKAL